MVLVFGECSEEIHKINRSERYLSATTVNYRNVKTKRKSNKFDIRVNEVYR